MEKWNGKIALVTGTTSGIGAAIATKLTNYGLTVVGVGRRKKRGEALAKTLISNKGKFYFFPVDITNEEEVVGIFKWIKLYLGVVHILINNAGVKNPTTLIDGDSKMWKDTFDTNTLALCVMTREAVKYMRENKVDGHIIHLNSIMNHVNVFVKDSNVYFGSKYAVTALTETLRLELNAIQSRIKISSISPDFVRTEMINPKCMAEYEDLKRRPMMDPDDVANAVVYVLSTPPHVQIHELTLRSLSKRYYNSWSGRFENNFNIFLCRRKDKILDGYYSKVNKAPQKIRK